MENKICVYAICKNESEWIERWLNNMSEADYIVVLDTGSTDNSFEILKKDPRVNRIEQKIITPWRFDVARNESMKLVPEDANILVCTDFDELFEEGWAQILRDHWEPKDTKCYYTYAWSHNELGEPQDVFKYDKIHTRDYYWKFPVHEVLYPIKENFEEYILDAEDHIYLHHFQDMSKERENYYDLLKLSVEENPDNAHCRMLLAREYLIKREPQKALEEYLACLDYEDIYEPSQISVLLETYGRLGDLYSWDMNNFEEGSKYYYKFISLDQTYREPYFCLADLFLAKRQPTIAIGLIKTALEFTYQHFNWVERKDNWLYKAEELLFYGYEMLDNVEEAYKYGKIAVQHMPENVELLKKYIRILEKKINLSEKMEDV